MMVRYTVPFYPNTPDDTHCYQAALRSVLKYFLPEKEYTWQELERMTAKKEGLWTWPTQGLITLHKLGFEVKDIGLFDIEEFVEKGEEYLIQEYGKEVAEEQIKHSDILQERALYKAFLQYHIYEKRLPTMDDIKTLVGQGYLVICNVNAKALNNKEGYVGHFVVVIGFDNEYVYFHDPGLPPQEDRKVSFEVFMKAWEYPDEKARNVTGLKYNMTILMASDVSWEDYKDLRLEALKEEPQAFAISYESQKASSPEEWQKRLESCRKGEHDWAVFASDGEKLVGIVGAYQTEGDKKNKVANMIALYVKKEARGKGVAKKLVNCLLGQLGETKRIKTVKLAVNADQEDVFRLYETLGFKLTGRQEMKLGDGIEHELHVMEKEL